jgi:hypothetical protein
MKRLTLTIVCICSLQACASYSPYQPASSQGYGYSQTQLSDTQFRIDFKARDIERGEAVNYAMLRAAELTLEKGFDWFEVVDRESDTTKPRATTRFGFGISRFGSMNPFSNLNAGVAVGGGNSNQADVLLEIIMGKGIRPDVKKVYSAKELAKNLRQSLVMPPFEVYD